MHEGTYIGIKKLECIRDNGHTAHDHDNSLEYVHSDVFPNSASPAASPRDCDIGSSHGASA